MKTIITLTLKKETKGALQYANAGAESDPLHVIDTLYVRKAGVMAAGGAERAGGAMKWPQSITVTVEG